MKQKLTAPSLPKNYKTGVIRILKLEKKQSGFTLIEVLVALAVIAVSLGALIAVSTQDIIRTELIQKRMFSNWIAQNQLAEERLFKNKVSVGSRKGTLRFANYDWEWETVTSKTTVDKFYRLDVSVSLLGDNVPSRSIVGFIFDDEIENE